MTDDVMHEIREVVYDPERPRDEHGPLWTAPEVETLNRWIRIGSDADRERAWAAVDEMARARGMS